MESGERRHEIAVRIGGEVLDRWTEYHISNDMLQASDAFSLSRPMHLDAWKLCRPDIEVQVTIDDTTVLTGYVGSRSSSTHSGAMQITGFCKAHRLVKESARGVGARFGGKDLQTLAADVAYPTFGAVVFSNVENRRLVKGRGRRVDAPESTQWSAEQRKAIFQSGNAPRRVEAGIKRWELLEQFVKEMDALMWSAADGSALIIGKPAYDQPAQYEFRVMSEGSNCTGIDYTEDIDNCYSMVVVPGSGRGSSDNYGLDTHHVGVARDNPDDEHGVGNLFLRPKVLVTRSQSASNRSAQRRARELFAERIAGFRSLTITAPHHGQWIDGSPHPTIFGFDNVCRVRKDVDGGTLIDDLFYITAVDFIGSADTQQTRITAVPLGTYLE